MFGRSVIGAEVERWVPPSASTGIRKWDRQVMEALRKNKVPVVMGG